ncbi:MAG: hypothetical protein RUMPE_00935 [Eubacteriales bacterium SKADARSKE-1]|nr:hypothetical protein [Eubacteriales bacterium SKADARSKE-1]
MGSSVLITAIICITIIALTFICKMDKKVGIRRASLWNLQRLRACWGKPYFYDTGQFNFDGCSIKIFYLLPVYLERISMEKKFYQADLKS